MTQVHLNSFTKLDLEFHVIKRGLLNSRYSCKGSMPRDDEDVEWNDSHRAFLQAFMARAVLTFEEAKPILSAISTVHGKH